MWIFINSLPIDLSVLGKLGSFEGGTGVRKGWLAIDYSTDGGKFRVLSHLLSAWPGRSTEQVPFAGSLRRAECTLHLRALPWALRIRVPGYRPYTIPTIYIGARITRTEGKPVVTSGFEPLDQQQSIVVLLRQLRGDEAKVANQYKRVVPSRGF